MNPDFSITLKSYFRLLRRNANFRRLWLAQLISGSGDWFYSVAIYDLLLRLTGSAATVAAAAVLQILPMFLLGPTAGAVNDRVSRRRVMIVTDVLRAFVVLGMLFVESIEQIPVLYFLLAAEIGMAAFFESARNASVPNIVADADIPVANAIGSTTWSVTVTAGAALGGLAIAFLGRGAAFLANSGSFLFSAWLISRTLFHEPHVEESGRLKWSEVLGFGPVVEGFRYVAGDWRLTLLLTLKFGLGILGARVVLVTVIGSKEFAVGGKATLGMSLLFMFQGLGSILGPLLVGRKIAGLRSRMRLAALVGYLSAALGYMAFSRITNLLLAGLALTLAHAGGALVWVFSTTLLHFHTDDRFRGRVFAADLGLFMVTASLSTYAAGWAIDHGAAARSAAFAVGAALLVPAAAWAWSLRRGWESEKIS